MGDSGIYYPLWNIDFEIQFLTYSNLGIFLLLLTSGGNYA